MRSETLKTQLVRLSQAFNKPLSDQELEVKTRIFDKALDSIPEAWLEPVCAEAIKACRFFPNPKALLDLWQDVKFEAGEQHQKQEDVKYLTLEDKEMIGRVNMHTPALVTYLESQGLRERPHEPLSWEEWNRFTRAYAQRFKIKLGG